MKEALYYVKTKTDEVSCFLCPHNCQIPLNQTGLCRARKNIGGKLFSLNYEQISSIAIDPIEKKPLYKYYPGSHILSVGSFGCNLKCQFCQNHEIAHGNPKNYTITSKQLIEQALNFKENIGIAYTYNEPSIWYEYIYSAAKAAHGKGLKNVMVTNGYISNEPLMELLKYIDAANIDVKSFNENYYMKICKAKLSHVKESVIQYMKKCHVEITFLAVTDLNDQAEEMEELSKWLSAIDDKVPLHILRFRPMYKMSDHKAQSYERILKLQDIALKYLKNVYAH